MPVDDAVVEAEREEHHFADDDLAVADDGLLLHLVHAQNAHLGEVQDGGGEEAALLAERGDGEGRALNVFELDLAVARVVRESLDLGADAEQRAPVGVFDDGHEQPRLGRGGDADVVVAAPHDLVGRLVEGAVQIGVALERGDDGLDDEGQETELDALGRGARLEPLAQIAQRGDVALFDEGEVGGRVLRARHLIEDFLAHALEGHALFEGLRGGRGRPDRDRFAGGGRRGRLGGAGVAGGRVVAGRGRGGVLAALGPAGRADVVFGDAAVGARGGHAAQVDVELAGELAGGGGGERLLREVVTRGGGAGALRAGGRGGGAAGREVHAGQIFADVADGGGGAARGGRLADRGGGRDGRDADGGGGADVGAGAGGAAGVGGAGGRGQARGDGVGADVGARREGRGGGRRRVGVEHDEVAADGDDLADLAAELENFAGLGARNGDGGLVGHHLGEGLVGLDEGADFDALGPGDDLALADALADIG